jgi:phosphoglycolate phosphatase-like HAD superfamily hydrolase
MGSSSGARPAPAVVFFDIDGTLVRRAGPHHKRALEAAAVQVTGVRATADNVPLQGMLDRKILEFMLIEAGLDGGRIRQAMPAMVTASMQTYLRDNPPSLCHRVCPGARAALMRLRAAGVPLGLVTGNFSRIGWLKLRRAGLGSFFSFGAFAEEAEDRAGLVRRAVMRARRRGWIGQATRIWHVGDHENDILAARANGVGCIAVATGMSSPRDLRALAPDRLLRDLSLLRVEMLVS